VRGLLNFLLEYPFVVDSIPNLRLEALPAVGSTTSIVRVEDTGCGAHNCGGADRGFTAERAGDPLPVAGWAVVSEAGWLVAPPVSFTGIILIIFWHGPTWSDG
jgi:hypothetical protein